MNTASISVSRPKIHRLPAIGTQKIRRKSAKLRFLMFLGTGLLTLLSLSAVVHREQSDVSANTISTASVIPNISVNSWELPAEETTVTSSVLSPPFGDAQAATGMTDLPDASQKKGEIILLQDKSDSIVGQMAKIPVENDQITEIKTITDINNNIGRELLSIIGKY